MNNLKQILQDIEDFNNLLIEYYDCVVKTDIDHSIVLTESENDLRLSILKDLYAVSKRLSNDIKAFSTKSCNSEIQKENENRNLVDLAGQFVNAILRCERLKSFDDELTSLFLDAKKNSKDFSNVLNSYIKKSDYKVYNWHETVQEYRKEEAEILEED